MEQAASGGSALTALSDALARRRRVGGAVDCPGRGPATSAGQRHRLVGRRPDRHRRSRRGARRGPRGRAAGRPHGSRRRWSGAIPGSDLAVLQAEATGLTPLARGGAPRVGSLALIVARPGDDPMASLGTVSAITGPIRTRRRARMEGLIVTDATFYPGFSGAPFVGADGQALGLATSRFGGGSGSGVIIPIGIVERVATALVGHGRVRRGFLGLGSQPVAIPEALRTRARDWRPGGRTARRRRRAGRPGRDEPA